MRILIVEDEPKTGSYLAKGLSEAGYVVDVAATGTDGLHLATTGQYDLVLLDVMLPGMDGWSVMRELRKSSQTPVLFLTARDEVDHRVKGLELGADDYLTKPFDTDELLARVRVALRNRTTRDGGSATVRAGEVEIDLLTRTIRRGGAEVHLTPKEYGVLAQLARYPGRVITHRQIMTEVWPHEHDHHVEYLRVLVRTLRQKLEADPQQPRIITNELGIGYRLRTDAEGGGLIP